MESKSKRSLLIVITVVLALVVIYFGFFNQKPNPDELAGTIGGVEKADKIGSNLTEEDIATLKTKYNDLIQSAPFQNLIKSPIFQKLVTDSSFIAILSNPDLRQDYVACLADGSLKTALNIPAVIDPVQNASPTEAMIEAGISQDSKLIPLYDNQDFHTLLLNPDYRELLIDNDIALIVANPSFIDCCAGNEIQSLVTVCCSPL
ncbi:MAG: hypothetical protein KBA26_02075 [Candidatus Delongbacteria bacterium]|nr:hypothetical protein [Candidatus Delongbacteria bacterium]